jgi:hypothetical protein
MTLRNPAVHKADCKGRKGTKADSTLSANQIGGETMG